MISVCMATYNGERFIKEQIDSILCQLSQDDELIISDDGSTDRTLEIISSYKDERIKLFYHKKNSEYAKIKYSRNFYYAIDNFENALKQAKGDYIFLCDQDDVWTENKVPICMEKLQNCSLLIHDGDIIDGNGNQIAPSFFKINHTHFGRLYNLLKNGYIGCCMCFSKKLLLDLLPFPKKLPMHDIYIGNFASLNGYKVCFTKEKLIHYRRHGGNASPSSERSHRKLSDRINDRMMILRVCKK